MEFDGKTFERNMDGQRLRTQLEQVFDLMKDASWRTLQEIALLSGCPEASISARLRDLRKAKFGKHNVNRRRRPLHDIFGVWEYQLLTAYNGLY